MMHELSKWRRFQIAHQFYTGSLNQNGSVRETGMGAVSQSIDSSELGERLQAYGHVNVHKLREINYGAGAYPVWGVEWHGRESDGRNLLVTSGIYGNETASILAVEEIVKDLKIREDLYDRVSLDVITPVNPVGAKLQTRYNGDGVDVSTDFNGRSQYAKPTIESSVVRNEIVGLKPRMIVSLQEGPQDGTLVAVNKSFDDSLAREVVSSLGDNGVRLAEENFLGQRLEMPGYVPFDWKRELRRRVFHVPTLNWYADRGGIPMITIQTPWRDEAMDTRIRDQVLFMRGVVETVVVD